MNAQLERLAESPARQRREYRMFKRGFDIAVSLLLLPILVQIALILLILNPFLNRGRLFYLQERMGLGCRPFRTIKFRTMIAAPKIARGPYDPPELHRITSLGRLLRRTRVDELPQIINVLKGEMSLIGPRPDYIVHARRYLTEIPGYRQRHVMRPGISGLAQITVGYVDTAEGVRAKTEADLYYIRNASVLVDCRIALRTLLTVIRGLGT